MSFQTKAYAGLLGLALCATPAQADLTPDQTWENLQEYVAVFNAALTGTVTTKANGLALTDVKATFTSSQRPGEGGEILFGDIELTARGDGTVQVIYPEAQQITLRETGADVNESALVQFNRTGLDLIASGDPGAVTYTVTADEVIFEMLEIYSPDAIQGDEDFKVRLAGTGLNGTSTVRTGDSLEISQTSNYDALRINLVVNSIEEGEQAIEIEATNASLRHYIQNENGGLDWNEFQASVLEGLAMGLEMSADTYNGAGSFDDPGEGGGQFIWESKGLEANYGFGAQGISYTAGGRDATVIIPAQPEIPIQLDFSIERFDTRVLFPLFATTAPQDIVWNTAIRGLEMGPNLWDTIDAEQRFPRDPINLELKTATSVSFDQFLFDVFDDEDPRFDVLGLDVETLAFKGLGLDFSGSAAFEGNFMDFERFGVMPSISGQSNFTIAGFQAFMDTLIEGGFIEPSDALGVRAAIAMVTTPGDEPDTLNSVIEMDAEAGTITANGMRIR